MNFPSSPLVGDTYTLGTKTWEWTGVAWKIKPAALAASDITSGVFADARIPGLTGDITKSSGSAATTLATVNSNVGSFGSATQVATFTVNAKGLTTAASNVTITPAWSSITSKPTTLSGYGITDAQGLDSTLTALAALTGAGVITATGTDTFAMRSIGTSNATDIPDRQTADTRYLGLSGGTLTGALTLSADPVSALQAATKQYVDNLVQGLSPKQSVHVATTANITLSGTQTIDGVAVIAGDRVLVKNQSTSAQNGIYVCAAGAWTRATDADAWTDLPSAFTFVEEGSTQSDTGWTCTVNAGGTIGSTSVTWVQFSGSATFTASTGIVKSGVDFQLTGQALALHSLATSGLIARTGSGTLAARSIAVPANGLSIANADGVSGNPTISLTNDLAAVEGLATTGFVRRTATDTWAATALTGAEITTALGYTPWHAGNDGVGSTLDADLLDGQQGTYYLDSANMTGNLADARLSSNIVRKDSASNVFTGSATFGGDVTLSTGILRGIGSSATVQLNDAVGSSLIYGVSRLTLGGPMVFYSNSVERFRVNVDGGTTFSTTSITAGGNTVWHAGNDGTGSNLDADLLDGQHGSYYSNAANLTGTVASARLSGAYTGITGLGAVAFSAIPNVLGADVLTTATFDASTKATLGNAVSFASVALSSTTAASLSSGGQGLQVGGTASTNIIADTTSIQARNNGVASTLSINPLGGNAYVGAVNAANAILVASSSLDATKLTGIVPDASLSGTYSGVSLKFSGGQVVLSVSPTSTGFTVSSVAQFRTTASSTTGAIVFSAPNTAVDIMHQLHVRLNSYIGGITDFVAQGYKAGAAWSQLNLNQRGNVRPMVRFASDASGRNCIIIGDVGTVWPYLHAEITHAMFSHTGASEAYCKDWTSAVVTSIASFTNVSADLNTVDTGYASEAAHWTTGRTISLTGEVTGTSAAWDGSGNLSFATSLTAASVLSKLLTVDGTGSNLDADLLDGQQGTYYRSATNINAGTLADAYLPSTMSGKIFSSAVTLPADIWTSGGGSERILFGAGAASYYKSPTTHNFRNGSNIDVVTIASTGAIVSSNSVTATAFIGNGSGLTGLVGSAISGTISATSLPALTGDITTSAGSAATTLATVNSNVGSFGSATAAPTFTVNAKGLLTAAGSTTITPAWSSITSKPTTLSGYGITDAQAIDAGLSSLAGLTGGGVVTATATDTFAMRAIGVSSSTDIPDRAAADTRYPILVAGTNTFTGAISLNSSNPSIRFVETDQTAPAGGWFLNANSDNFYIRHNTATPVDFSSMNIVMSIGSNEVVNFSNTPTVGGVALWHANNDGAGSTLDADLLDGQQGSFYQNAGNLNAGTLLAARMPAHTGDVTSSAGAVALTLATVNSNVGSFGSATAAPTFTVNAKGLITAAGTVTITPAWGSITSKPTTISGYGITDLLTSIQAIDGVASGIDSDLLDGQQGSYYLDSTNLTGTIPAGRMPAHTGDVTSSAGAVALTLATVNANVGSFGSATAAPTFTVNAKGLITAAGSATITPAWSSITSKPTTLSDYSITAADVLSTLLTVDGVGSGLDADLLDGSQRDSSATGFVANSIPIRGSSGYLFTNFLNTTANQITTTNVRLAVEQSTDGYIRWQTASQFLTNQGIWTSSNDGAGSGLDADLLDGVQGSGYVNTTSAQTVDGSKTFTGVGSFALADATPLKVERTGSSSNLNIEFKHTGATRYFGITSAGVLSVGSSADLTSTGSTIWTSGNDGASSGLDADLLDGQHGSYYNAAGNLTGTIADARISGAYTGITSLSMTGALTVNGSLGNWSVDTQGNAMDFTRPSANYIRASNASGSLYFQTGGVNNRLLIESNGNSTFTGAVTATSFSGSGASLTALNASNLSSGTVASARIAGAYSGITALGTQTSDMLFQKSNPWLTLRGSGADAAIDQGSGISIGESGYKGVAAIHITYTGDGYGHIGMGVVSGSTNLPAYEAMRLCYTDSIVRFYANPTVNGNTIWHAGNDGASSGLDADLLDGQHGSFYQSASNLNAGTVPDARITGAYSGITNLTMSGTLTALNVTGGGSGLTSLNASNLGSGTVPNARLSGVYSDIGIKLTGTNTVFGEPNSGTQSSTARTVTDLVSYRNSGGAATGAIVFIAPNILASIMHRLKIEGYIYTGGPTISAIVQGYKTTTWSQTSKINLGITDVQVRFGQTPDGRNCVILGDVGTTWNYTHIGITHAMFSHGSIADSYCYGWTTELVTDLSSYTQVTGTIANNWGYDGTNLRVGGNLVWNSSNDGAGSTLDADLLDGVQGGNYARLDLTTTQNIGGYGLYLNGGRGISLGYSGGNYGSIGYNVNYTTTSDLHTAPSNDTASMLSFNSGGMLLKGNAAGVGGRTITWTTILSVPLSGSMIYQGNTVWTGGNDGAGSGLDADLLDGQEGSYYRNASNINVGTIADAFLPTTMTGKSFTGSLYTTTGADRSLTLSSSTSYNYQLITAGDHFQIREASDAGKVRLHIAYPNGHISMGAPTPLGNLHVEGESSGGIVNNLVLANRGSTDGSATAIYMGYQNSSLGHYGVRLLQTSNPGSTRSSDFAIQIHGSAANNTDWTSALAIARTSGNISFSSSTVTAGGNTVWHAGNDGAGSGLDADLLDGQNSSTSSVASTIVSRDGSAQVTAHSFHTVASPGLGVRFWESSAYSIYMSESGNGTWGGRVTTESTSDYNMYFKMTSGNNRGFVFLNGTTPTAQIDASGNIRNTGFTRSKNGFSDYGSSGSANISRLNMPGGASYQCQSSSVTGALKIKLPTMDSNAMMRFRVEVFNYSTGKSSTFVVSGYPYSSSWVNCSAEQYTDTGTPLSVRFGHDGATNCVWIGEVGTVWYYPQVFVTDFNWGYSSVTSDAFSSNWAISFATSLGTVSVSRAAAYHWNSSNDGSGSGLDADLLDGLNASVSASASTIVARDASGYMNTSYLYMTADQTTSAATRIAVDTSSDNYLRWQTPAQFITNHSIYTASHGVWTSSNDGAGSGLDADLLDGLSSASFLQTSGAWTMGGTLTNNSGFYTSDWFRQTSSNGMYWQTYNHGICAPEQNSSYGTIQMYGAGLNGYNGIALNTDNKTILMTNGTSWGMYNPVAGIWMMIGDMSGNLTFSGNVTAYSDLRLKENARPIDNVTARRDNLAAAAIIYERDGRTRIGYGAQTVREVNPEFVHEADDAMKLATDLGTLSVDYGETAAILAAASKNTDDEVAALKEQVRLLTEMVTTLMKERE